MNRRTLMIGLGATAAGGAVIGSGAFTSVEAEREVSVNVAGDADAFLRLAPTGDPNGQYATGAADGTLELDFSGDNEEIDGGGEGFNPESVTVARNVFEVQNQGTQDIEVDFEGPEGDPAVFPDEDAILLLLPENASLPFPLELNSGESQKMSVIAAVSDGIAPEVDSEYTVIAEATE